MYLRLYTDVTRFNCQNENLIHAQIKVYSSQPLGRYNNILTVHVCTIVNLLLLRPYSQICLTSISVGMVSKWFHVSQTSRYLAGNCHVTRQSNWATTFCDILKNSFISAIWLFSVIHGIPTTSLLYDIDWFVKNCMKQQRFHHKPRQWFIIGIAHFFILFILLFILLFSCFAQLVQI